MSLHQLVMLLQLECLLTMHLIAIQPGNGVLQARGGWARRAERWPPLWSLPHLRRPWRLIMLSRQAMDDEMASLKANQTWVLEELPEHARALPSKWVLTAGMPADNAPDRYLQDIYLQQATGRAMAILPAT